MTSRPGRAQEERLGEDQFMGGCVILRLKSSTGGRRLLALSQPGGSPVPLGSRPTSGERTLVEGCWPTSAGRILT